MLTASDCRGEDIVVLAVIVPELKLRNVQRQILLTNLVELADHAGLEDRPEAFNRVRVDGPNKVLIARVIDGGVLRIAVIEAGVAGEEIRATQGALLRPSLAAELLKRFR